MEKQIEELHDLAEIIYMGGYGLLREDCTHLAEQIQEQGYRKQEDVARDIFAEIEGILKLKKKIEIERRDEYKKLEYPMFSYLSELGGRIYGYSVVEEQIAELKKKYGVTEDE